MLYKMNEEIYLPNGTKAFKASYYNTLIEEYNTNPLIQALPSLQDKQSIIKNLFIPPSYNKDEKWLDSSLRLHLVQRLYRMFQPLPIHIKIWNMVMTLLRQGYLARNPFDTDYRRFVNETGKQIINRTYDVNNSGNFRTTASCGLLIGYSGMGKTTLCNLILNCLPQVLIHNEYKNQHYNQIQVTWLKLEAPYNSSLKSLCLQFFMKIDELLGSDNFRKSVSRNLSVDAMIPLMGHVANNNIKLGILVIDEIQHLENRGLEKVMNFFVTLINSFGIPIIMIGTPASYHLFEGELRIARRVSGSSAIVWNNMSKDDEFKLFLEGIWKYQWTRDFISLDNDIIDIFYEETQGISDLVIKLFVNSQQEAIINGNEQITPAIIRKVAKEQFKLMKPMIEAIKSGNPYRIAQYQDIQKIDIKDSVISSVIQEPTREHISKKVNKHPKDISSTHINKSSEVKKKVIFEDDDLRQKLKEGEGKGESPYQVLYENGFIDNMEDWVEGMVDNKL